MTNATVNKVTLIGYLGEEVKLRYYEAGNCIGRFSLATNEEFVNKKNGEKMIFTEWHTIVMKNKAAEVCEKYLSKGDKIYIEGRVKYRQWQSPEGTTKNIAEIHASEFMFLNTKKSQKNQQNNDIE